jgi:hypothetical protein
VLLDKGGARIREEAHAASIDAFIQRLQDDKPKREKAIKDHERKKAQTSKGPKVRVRVEETHDGEACECITKEMTVEIGQSIELEHICHDGRVDIVRATVISVD